MNLTAILTKSVAAMLSLVSTRCLQAQYGATATPAPFAGFANEALRKNNSAMTNWDLGGSLRLRYEDKEGSAIPGAAGSMDFRDHGADVSNDYLLSRIRLHAGYSKEWWSLFVEGRSSLVAGDDRFAYPNSPAVAGTVRRKGSGPEADTIDLHQAYLAIGNQEFPLSLQVGRQELIYGEERIIGAYGWNNIGRVFDAVKLRWKDSWGRADFFGSRVVIPEDGRFNVDNNYDCFSGAYVTITKVSTHLLDVYLLARNASAQAIAAEPSPQAPLPSARDIYTLGVRLKSKPGELGAWDYSIEAAGQLGDFKDLRLGTNSARLNHEAWMVVAQGGYTFTNTWAAPRLGFEYSQASGDSNPHDGKHETFENLFPTNHKFYGYMDFFSLQNIHDVRGSLQLKPHSRMSLALEGHGFWLADTHDNFYSINGAPRGGVATTSGTGYGVNPSYSSFVGTELDLVAGWAVTRYTQVEAGYGHFFTGDYIRQSLSDPAVGSRVADWFYVQLGVNF